MARFVGVLSLVVSLAAAGVLMSSQLGGTSGTTADDSPAVARASAAAASATALQAEQQLNAYRAEHDTFVGATVSGIADVTVLHADAASFCLQLATGNGALYDAGPGGTPTAQRC
jgi:hypothetical protein